MARYTKFSTLPGPVFLICAMMTGSALSETESPPLPDPLRMEDGTPVTRPAQWPARRAEILSLFEEHVYGRIPGGKPDGFHFTERKRVGGFLDGKATLLEIRVHFTADPDGPGMDLMVVSPAKGGPVPAFLGLNFKGNHTLHPDPEIAITPAWTSEGKPDQRGARASRWPLEAIIGRGFALATACYGEIDPDFDDGFKNGVHPLFDAPGGTRAADAWGSIGAWAWGMSRALDVLEQIPEIDAKRVAAIGHSRLGKTALWAAANDERFAMAVSNNSGCGGAALSRRAVGETVKAINDRFPHWFCGNFKRYNGREQNCPVDQHQLLALIAPRPLYVASASEDAWADPEGEFLAARHAGPVYRLLGREGLGIESMPAPDESAGDFVAYHIRTGKHDITPADWNHYLDFAVRHFGMRDGD